MIGFVYNCIEDRAFSKAQCVTKSTVHFLYYVSVYFLRSYDRHNRNQILKFIREKLKKIKKFLIQIQKKIMEFGYLCSAQNGYKVEN